MDKQSSLRLEPYSADKHYGLIRAWWAARGDQALPADVLPPSGAMAVLDGEPIAHCAIWLTNAKCAYLAFPIAAPNLKPKLTYLGVRAAIEGAIEIAIHAGCKMIWATAENRGVDRIFTKEGFKRASPLNSYFMLFGGSSDTLTNEKG